MKKNMPRLMYTAILIIVGCVIISILLYRARIKKSAVITYETPKIKIEMKSPTRMPVGETEQRPRIIKTPAELKKDADDLFIAPAGTLGDKGDMPTGPEPGGAAGEEYNK